VSPERKMPSFSKPPPELSAAFAKAVERLPDAQQRQMFGQPAAFVNGQMFTGLFGPRWFIRVPDDDAKELLAMEGGGSFEVMPGRAMKGYVILPPAVVANESARRKWLERSLSYAASLPPKAAKSGGARRKPRA
jgi:TfoX/Sxy family transcriptional regulator of competence genes